MTPTDINIISLGDRYRTDYGDITSLAESLRIYGLIEPIVLDRNHNLIAGGRRLTAAKLLGWSTIPAVFRDEVDDLLARELELEENIRRKDLTWVEEAQLTAEIDRIKRERFGSHTGGPVPLAAKVLGPNANLSTVKELTGWDLADSAASLNTSVPTVHRNLTAAAIIAAVPELANEPDRKTAIKKFYRILDEAEREFAVRQFLEAAAADPTAQTAPEPRLGDAVEILRTRPSGSVDCVVTDPPYGVSVDTQNIGRYQATGGVHFDDTAQTAMDTARTVFGELRRVLRVSGHLYAFCAIKLLRETMDLLDSLGFNPDPIPLIWVKNTDSLVPYDKRFAGNWEPIIYCRGDESRPLNRKRSNVFTFDAVESTDKVNVCEKPTALLAELIGMSTREGEVVYDPFAGSGATLVAAASMNRIAQGSERDPDQWNAAILRVREARDALTPPVEEEVTEDA